MPEYVKNLVENNLKTEVVESGSKIATDRRRGHRRQFQPINY
ncbi:hypothetical protein [Moorena sp. SIOASIH]|nr:hypothetical protein [Moorena sp. SIOASIH]